MKESHKVIVHPVTFWGKNHSTENCYLGANAANRPSPRNRRPEGQNQSQQRDNQNISNDCAQAAAQNLN